MNGETYALAHGPDDAPLCICCDALAPERRMCAVLANDARFCRCPACETVYRTPIHHVLGILTRAVRP